MREGQPKLRQKMTQIRGYDSATSGSLAQAGTTGTITPDTLQSTGFDPLEDTISRDIFDRVLPDPTHHQR